MSSHSSTMKAKSRTSKKHFALAVDDDAPQHDDGHENYDDEAFTAHIIALPMPTLSTARAWSRRLQEFGSLLLVFISPEALKLKNFPKPFLLEAMRFFCLCCKTAE